MSGEKKATIKVQGTPITILSKDRDDYISLTDMVKHFEGVSAHIVKMEEIKPARTICLDAGFKGNDQHRTNALEIMKSHGVTDFRTG